MSSVNLTIYRIGVFVWIFLGMSYISLIINLLLEFLKGNADNFGKELKTILEEKVSAFAIISNNFLLFNFNALYFFHLKDSPLFEKIFTSREIAK